mmetsp:Transcript_3094/g.8394  ORF Transcript_3094/g.8394 Transcript_3094/m.8394 type:complete len:214 (-) Transcript_3094:605-1246(-)
MNPKAASLPRINVRTGAAKPRKLLESTKPSMFSLAPAPFTSFFFFFHNPRERSRTNRFRAGPSKAYVAAHCAKSVAVAAPRRPIPATRTSRKSPTIFTTVEYRIAINGVTESFPPRRAAWTTLTSKEVGKEKALIFTYSTAESINAGSAPWPMYKPNKGRAKAIKNNMIPIPHLNATRLAVRTTASASSDCSPRWVSAVEYKFVVATFKKAKR